MDTGLVPQEPAQHRGREWKKRINNFTIRLHFARLAIFTSQPAGRRTGPLVSLRVAPAQRHTWPHCTEVTNNETLDLTRFTGAVGWVGRHKRWGLVQAAWSHA